MHKIITIFALILFFISSASYAEKEKINTKSIKDAGFEEVSKLLEQMSPEQLEQIMKQAKTLLPELEQMNKEEIDSITQQLLQMEESINASTIDTSKLDVSKSKDFDKIMSDLQMHNQTKK